MLHTGYGNGSVRPVDAAALVEHFEIHGWVVLRDVLATAQLAELKAAFEALLPPTLMPALPHSDGIPHPIEPSRRHPAFARWLAVAGPFDAAARCLGSARVQLLQDDLLVKRPGADDTLAWHQDASYLGGLDPLRSVSIRFALDRETPESGCMWVIDGSHRIRSVTPFSQDAPRRVEDALAGATATLRAAARPLELEAGDVSIHDAYTFHASHANHSQWPRRTLVARVIASDCRFVHARLPPELAPHFPTTSGGYLDPERFPLLPLDR